MSFTARVIHLWLGVCLRTTRWHIVGTREGRRALTQAENGCVVAFWHGQLALSLALWFWIRWIEPRRRLNVLISRNTDGRLIAKAVYPWAIQPIFGSSARRGKDKGGAAALRAAVNAVRSGTLVAIAPDGPRGPANTAQPGISALSRITQCAVVPVGLDCPGLRLPSWDRLLVPRPFGRGTIVVGAPLLQPDQDTLEAALQHATRAARQRRITLTRLTVMERLWSVIGCLLAPALIVLTHLRLRRGREIRTRLRERMGLSRAVRPSAPLLWIHAASVGETLCARPLLDALLAQRTDLHILFTTATVTGAEMIARHPAFGQRITHQFIPHDVPLWVRRFLRRWRPQGAVFIESELWPGILAALSRHSIPAMVVNGRLSDRSARRWQRFHVFVRPLFSRLRWVAARGAEDAGHFQRLGVSTVYHYGDLKQDAMPLPCDEQELARLRTGIGNRPVFVAASTHPGEEEIVLKAAEIARRHRPDLLTILVPRHPARGAEIGARFDLPRRSQGRMPDATMPTFLADTLGELGLFYRLAQSCFLGHSLVSPGGGHNPFEPLRLGVPTATGPYMTNWREAMHHLEGTVTTVRGADDLAAWLVHPVPTPSVDVSHVRVAEHLTTLILETLER